MLESDDIHLCRCNASSDNRKVSIIYCVSRNIIPNIGRDKSLADDLNMLRGIVSRGVVFALRPAEIRPSYHRFVRTDISPPTYTPRHTHCKPTPHIETPLDPIEPPSIHKHTCPPTTSGSRIDPHAPTPRFSARYRANQHPPCVYLPLYPAPPAPARKGPNIRARPPHGQPG